ncbi:MAG: 3-deoxy-7-phosphoheptulonate synthase [Planctomycetes bacterium]|nr:3-deoxy-7-phosphoheptulonate synthase [Planctomycetota bacterium]
MIIIMKPGATDEQIDHVIARIKEAGCNTHVSRGQELTIIGAIGDETKVEGLNWRATPGVERAERVTKPWKIASLQMHPKPSVIDVAGVKIGGGNFTVMAGPCTVEDKKMLFDSAGAVKKAGAKILRGGAFKPRTSPYDFMGLGEEGLKLLQAAGREFGMPTVTEVRTLAHVEVACRYCDMLQIGARNMQNYDLLTEVGKARKPVLLKRGFAAQIKELLLAAEYILSGGNTQVVLCERGMRTFETATRFTFDVSAIPVLKEQTHLPVVFDPSHPAGKAALVPPLARAGVAAGADGMIVEVHCAPEEARCDGDQAMQPGAFEALMKDCAKIFEIVKGNGR